MAKIGERISVKNPFLNIDGFAEIAFDERLLKVVARYLEGIPIASYSADRSFVLNKFLESAGWHRDTFTTRRLNVFIYLNDVTAHRGPLYYLSKSHNAKFKSFRPLYNWEQDINSEEGRIQEDEMLKFYSKSDMQKFLVPKGTAVIADVSGYHKGPIWTDTTDPKNNFRDAIAMSFVTSSFKAEANVNIGSRNNVISRQQYRQMTDFQRLFTKHFNIR